MQKWEYTTMYWYDKELYIGAKLVANEKNAPVLSFMQQLGEQGWEMVTAVSESMCFGGSAKYGYGGIRWYFKRPKS